MPQPAFIVEGDCEQRVVQRICPGTPVRILGRNGRDVTVDAMARQVDALSRRFINRNYPIVVIVDREQRNETAEQLSAQLIEKLESQGVDVSQFQVYLSTE